MNNMPAPSAFPTIRACIFDVDGLLINSEDIYTEIYNNILHEYGAPNYPWTIKAKQQSRGTSVSLKSLLSLFQYLTNCLWHLAHPGMGKHTAFA
jgi:phosphoglycolate phosphatase-like HAD superfamily hydrolase